MSDRKLATIRVIEALQPIEGADRIELAIIGGWQVIVKKDSFKVNQPVMYLECDSWVPHNLAPFLTKPGHLPKEFNGIEGQRLKTIRMKGELSQGLVLPIEDCFPGKDSNFYHSAIDEDFTEALGITKWEKPMNPQMAGFARGNFPSEVPKTDQERIQNLKKKLPEFMNKEWQVTEKLHGCSATFYLDEDGEFHVCSRNIDLKDEGNPLYWQVAKQYDIEAKMRRHFLNRGYAIQGEIIGHGINGNQYGLAVNEVAFYVFDIYSTLAKGKFNPQYTEILANELGLRHVPVLRIGKLPGHTVEELLAYAEGKSDINGSEREGVVFKELHDSGDSFKVVSNRWLLGGGEDQ
jgi:RNA ligase (TIGR02306 family)